jgi:hypothetical protein
VRKDSEPGCLFPHSAIGRIERVAVYTCVRCGASLGVWCREGTVCAECADADRTARSEREAGASQGTALRGNRMVMRCSPCEKCSVGAKRCCPRCCPRISPAQATDVPRKSDELSVREGHCRRSVRPRGGSPRPWGENSAGDGCYGDSAGVAQHERADSDAADRVAPGPRRDEA